MNNKTAPLVIIIITILVITAAIWLVLWQSVKPTNQNQNVNQVNTNQAQGGVTITTDKAEYLKGENINIIIINNQSEVIYTYFGRGWDIYRLENNNWSKLDTICTCRPTCQNGELKNLCPQLAPPLYKYSIFENPEKVKWNQVYCLEKTEKCGDQDYTVGALAQASSGQYKIKFCYWDKNDINLTNPPGTASESKKKCVEKEFAIKEKSTGVTIATDKTEYQKGESVKITVTNSTAQKIGFEPNFSPAFGSAKINTKDDQGEWNYVSVYIAEPTISPPPQTRDWSVILDSGEHYSFTWDQKVLDLTLANKPLEERRSQAPTGTYRFQLQWYYPKTSQGDTVDSNEFTLKEQITCGGFRKIQCPVGYYCYINPDDLKVSEDPEGICKPKDEKSCQTTADCVLIQTSCCPCSSGGTMTCINKEFKDVLMPLDCSGIACPEVYLCDSQPTRCVCSNNQCEGIRPSVATNVNYSLPDIKNKEECEAQGAHWVAVGKRAVCEFSAPDAGKECNKSTDCVRVCRIDNLDDIIGTCSEFSVGGCHRYLDSEGKARMICSD